VDKSVVQRTFQAAGIIVAMASVAGCSFQQSALHPAGRDAEELASLTWFMFGAGAH